MGKKAVQIARLTRHGIVVGGLLIGIVFIWLGVGSENIFFLMIGIIFLVGALMQQWTA